MPRKTIQSLEAEIRELKISKNFYVQICDDIRNVLNKMNTRTLATNELVGEVTRIVYALKDTEGSVDARVWQISEQNKSLLYLLRCALKDPTLELENLSKDQLYDMAMQRDNRGKNPIM